MDFGIVYHFETPNQFWAELEDILNITHETSLQGIDYALKTFVEVCANNHERFLQTNAQLDHASAMLLESELFTSHSQRSTDHILSDAKKNVDPHAQLILYKVLVDYGFRQPSFFKNLKKWSPLIPFLMDHVQVEIDDGNGYGYGSGTGGAMGLGYPIEARLRTISVFLLYEVCRVQKIDGADLKLFSEDFINHLFDLVEETRNNPDETLNYGLIKLIVALNEQFMVASLPPSAHCPPARPPRNGSPALGSSFPKSPTGRDSPSFSQTVPNRVLNVLMRRLGASKTFGENLIFMLNRAENTPEDLCMQLLVLKLLYLLFTTHGTQEYFYTNDLRVLVDVFIRELVDLPDESESLRHTYLRVLHPLLTNTQLRTHPYKLMQIRNVLQSLTAHANIRDITATTRRLVDRCLRAQWCKTLEADLVTLQLNQSESLSVDSGAKSKSAFVTSDDSKAGGKTIHKSASMTFTKPVAPGLVRAPSKSAGGHAASKDVSTSSGENGRIPRSADATSGAYSFAHHHPLHHHPDRASSLDEVGAAGGLLMPSLGSLSIADPHNHSSTSVALAGGADTPPTKPSAVSFSVTASTPVEESSASSRPRSDSTRRDKSLPPPPRPPRKLSNATRFEPPSRSGSIGEVSRSGVESDERLVAGTPTLVPPHVVGAAIRRSAPPTPPPKRRKAPAVPSARTKTSTMTTIASSSGGGAAAAVGVPVR